MGRPGDRQRRGRADPIPPPTSTWSSGRNGSGDQLGQVGRGRRPRASAASVSPAPTSRRKAACAASRPGTRAARRVPGPRGRAQRGQVRAPGPRAPAVDAAPATTASGAPPVSSTSRTAGAEAPGTGSTRVTGYRLHTRVASPEPGSLADAHRGRSLGSSPAVVRSCASSPVAPVTTSRSTGCRATAATMEGGVGPAAVGVQQHRRHPDAARAGRPRVPRGRRVTQHEQPGHERGDRGGYGQRDPRPAPDPQGRAPRPGSPRSRRTERAPRPPRRRRPGPGRPLRPDRVERPRSQQRDNGGDQQPQGHRCRGRGRSGRVQLHHARQPAVPCPVGLWTVVARRVDGPPRGPLSHRRTRRRRAERPSAGRSPAPRRPGRPAPRRRCRRG